jgi:ribosome-binding protein aMBF1 (putative translation factor)
MDMTPQQSRAARGWLGWSQTDLANRAEVSLSTVRDFELGNRTPIPVTLGAMRRTFEEAGVRFLFRHDGSAEGIAS